MEMKDKVCIITGAASGIGKEIAARFAREGGKVVIADLEKCGAERVAAEIAREGPVVKAVAMDVTDEAQVQQGIAAVVSFFGGIDVLVSNAGVQIVHPIESFPFADWRKMLAIHLDGAFLTIRACFPI